MRISISKVSAFIAALIISLAAICPLLSTECAAFDSEHARGGTVPVIFYLKNPQYVYVNSAGEVVGRESLGVDELECSGGSGFFVGKKGDDAQYIVTNHHVVSEYLSASEGETFVQLCNVITAEDGSKISVYIESQSCEMRIYYSETEYDVAYIDCYGDMEKVDLAVLKLRNPIKKRNTLKIAPVSEKNTADQVYAVGYPGNADNMFSSDSHYGLNDSSVYDGKISKIVMDSKGVERIDVTAKIQHGNSGGPLINEDGYVLGVNTNINSNSPYDMQIEANYYAISSNTLMEFLDKNSIPYEKADSSGEGGSKTAIFIIIGAVVAAAAVVAVVVVMKKKSGGTASPAGAGMGKSSKNAPAKEAFVRSMSPQHNGQTFPVGKAPVVIGRNPGSCVIIYQEGTKGVSGVHCSVSYDSATDAFSLTDLKSSYGTFLMNGQKLTENTPVMLRSGDSFYVGDKSNVCRVEVVQK